TIARAGPSAGPHGIGGHLRPVSACGMTLVSAEEDGPSHRGPTRTGTSQSQPGGMNSAPALPLHQSAPADQAGARSALTSRIEALDLVRLPAIVGMMATHLPVPRSMTPEAAGPESAAARIAGVLAEGAASTLFAVVGGCSLVLAAR